MSTQELQALQLISLQFHLLICTKRPADYPRCKAALLAKEQLKAVGHAS